MVVNMTKAIDTDSVFLDTGAGGTQSLQDKLNAAKAGVIIQSEGEPGLYDLQVVKAGLTVNSGTVPMQLFRDKWFERRYMTHILKKNSDVSKDITDSIHNAFFNGVGIELQENCFSAPNLIDYRSRTLLRTLLPIQRRYAAMFSDNVNEDSWTPLVDTNSDSLIGSLWTNNNIRLWTLSNDSSSAISGNLITVPHVAGNHYYNLITGMEIIPTINGSNATLNFSVVSRGIIGIVAGNTADLGADFNTFLSSQATVNNDANYSTLIPSNPEIIEPVTETTLYTSDPTGMKGFNAQTNYYMDVQFRSREGALQPYYQTAKQRNVNLSAFAIDINAVTNAQYKSFMNATGYNPSNKDNFLKLWVNNVPPTAIQNDPVVYVSYEDAVAYANWAGKRLPTEEEFTYAYQQGALNFGSYRVWNMTSSIRHDNQSKTMILKGGVSLNQNASGIWWYPDDASIIGVNTDYRWDAVYNVSGAGINREGTFGFRCAVDKN